MTRQRERVECREPPHVEALTVDQARRHKRGFRARSHQVSPGITAESKTNVTLHGIQMARVPCPSIEGDLLSSLTSRVNTDSAPLGIRQRRSRLSPSRVASLGCTLPLTTSTSFRLVLLVVRVARHLTYVHGRRGWNILSRRSSNRSSSSSGSELVCSRTASPLAPLRLMAQTLARAWPLSSTSATASSTSALRLGGSSTYGVCSCELESELSSIEPVVMRIDERSSGVDWCEEIDECEAVDGWEREERGAACQPLVHLSIYRLH